MTRRRLPFQDEMVRAIRRTVDPKTVTRRTSDRFGAWRPGDVIDACEGLRESDEHDAISLVAFVEYTSDGARPGGRRIPWDWQPRRLAPRYCPAALVRTRLEVVSITREAARGCNKPDSPELCFCAWTGCALLPAVDDAEARREGVADRAAYLALWRTINGDAVPNVVWRIEFRRLD